MSKRTLVSMCSIFLIVPLLFMGCGSDGSNGKNGINGTNGTNGTSGRDLTATPQPESCAICHEATTTGSILSGADHQAFYDSLFQDNVLRVTGLTYALNGSNQDNVTFTMSLAGAPFDCRDADALNVYWVPTTDNDTFTASRTLKTTVTYLGAGVCSVTKASLDNVSLSTKNGFIVVYGYDHFVSNLLPSRVKQESYPFAALLTEGTASYASAANVSGCEKCHTIPYLKHGQIYGEVNHVAATDFITCKACHMDLDGGGHQFWQELVDNPVIATHDFNGTLTSADNAYVAAHYAYKTRLMNDVHMSHAMEFGYPQSMANCATCHAGKLNQIFTDNNFTLETCRSCHPVTGSAQAEKTQPALKDILPAAIHGTYDLYNNATNCNGCHKAGGIAPVFSAIHTGYDKKIYTDNGIKYSSIFNVTIDNASFDNTNKLTIGFSATGSQSGLVPTNIVPTVLVGLYGWDTKDFLFGPHETNADGKRNLEFVVTDNTHPRMKLVSAGGGHWTVTANLSQWADNIVAGNVKRVEIAVLPTLAYSALPAGDNVLALNAPSRTYNLGAKAFVNNYYAGTNAIVNVAAGCNTCHDALATTFHTADRGGNIVVCRLCHITKAGASHLEMESRSIDSYAHAIHTFQAFDIGSVHFDNAVQSMYYDLKIESHFPTFDARNCVACHYAGKFEVPDQSKSLPGVFSASAYPLIGKTRAIGTVPAYISGPASRACGGCHRAELIKEDDIATLTAFNSHVRTNGYLLETTSATATADVTKVIFQVMSNYSETIVLPAP